MNIEGVKAKLDDIIALVEEAGEALSRLYTKQDLDVSIKPDASPVTEADRLSNEILQSGLSKLFPDTPTLSEESDIPAYEVRHAWPYFWMIDPLDGTKEFIYRNGRFCINLALIHDERPVFGLIHVVREGEILYAFAGEPCHIKKNGQITRLNPIPQANEKKIRMVVSRFNMTEAEFQYIDHLRSQGLEVELIPLGASAKHVAIAKGEADVFPKFGQCYEWDTAAGQLLVESSGGMVFNPNDFSDVTYNKRELLSPPQISFAKGIRERIEGGELTCSFTTINNDYGTR